MDLWLPLFSSITSYLSHLPSRLWSSIYSSCYKSVITMFVCQQLLYTLCGKFHSEGMHCMQREEEWVHSTIYQNKKLQSYIQIIDNYYVYSTAMQHCKRIMQNYASNVFCDQWSARNVAFTCSCSFSLATPTSSSVGRAKVRALVERRQADSGILLVQEELVPPGVQTHISSHTYIRLFPRHYHPISHIGSGWYRTTLWIILFSWL